MAMRDGRMGIVATKKDGGWKKGKIAIEPAHETACRDQKALGGTRSVQEAPIYPRIIENPVSNCKAGIEKGTLRSKS